MTDYPKLRSGLESFPMQEGGRRLILIRDRLGFCEEPVVVTEAVAALMMLMNGQNSLRDIQAHHMRTTGELLYMENLKAIAGELDAHFLLESERFIQKAAQEVARFQREPVRRMMHAGKSYPDDPEMLRSKLDRYFDPKAGGPGIPQRGSHKRRLLGLVAPHIDLDAGGACFAHAYKASAEAIAPEIWVVLGTGHEWVENYFAILSKDFETPLGHVRCAKEYCTELLESSPRDLLASEYNHYREHSIEFQAVFLAHIHPGAAIVPVLCSFSCDEWEADRDYIDGMAAALRNLGHSGRRSVGYLASVDLAHVGPRYGDRFRPHAGTISQHLADDKELLEYLRRCDSQGYMQKLHREQNRRRICGMAPLYMLSKILEGQAEGTVLHHTHAVVDQENSFVTFAGMSFLESSDPVHHSENK